MSLVDRLIDAIDNENAARHRYEDAAAAEAAALAAASEAYTAWNVAKAATDEALRAMGRER